MDVLGESTSQANYKGTEQEMIGTEQAKQTEEIDNDMKEIAKAIKYADKQNTKRNHILEDAVAAYQAGDDCSFDILYKEYRPKFEGYAARKKDDDAVQELSIALIKAAKTYKPDANTKFNTYFWTIARKHMGTVNIYKHAQKRHSENGVVSLNKQVSFLNDSNVSGIELQDCIADETIETKADESLFKMFLAKDIFPKLKPDEAKAIDMLLDGYTLAQIGEACGHVSAPAIHTKIRSLRNKPISLNIKEWLENR